MKFFFQMDSNGVCYYEDHQFDYVSKLRLFLIEKFELEKTHDSRMSEYVLYNEVKLSKLLKQITAERINGKNADSEKFSVKDSINALKHSIIDKFDDKPSGKSAFETLLWLRNTSSCVSNLFSQTSANLEMRANSEIDKNIKRSSGRRI